MLDAKSLALVWERFRMAIFRNTWPVQRGRKWIELVNDPGTEAELAALRRSLNRGTPFGTTVWQQRNAKRLGLESSLRNPGRPRKKPSANKITQQAAQHRKTRPDRPDPISPCSHPGYFDLAGFFRRSRIRLSFSCSALRTSAEISAGVTGLRFSLSSRPSERSLTPQYQTGSPWS